MYYFRIHTSSYILDIRNNIKRRFEQHNKGRVNSTEPYRPYRIIYYEETDSKAAAVKREKELKLTKGRRFLKQFI